MCAQGKQIKAYSLGFTTPMPGRVGNYRSQPFPTKRPTAVVGAMASHSNRHLHERDYILSRANII